MNSSGLPMTTLLDDAILPRNVANILAAKIGSLLNLDELTFNDAVVTPEGEWFRIHVDLNPPDLQLTPFGPEAITFGVHGGEPVIVEAFFSDEKIDLRFDVTIAIELPPALLRRVETQNGSNRVDLTCRPRIGIHWGRIEEWQMRFELLDGLTLPPSEIAATGFQISAEDVRPSIIPGRPIAQVIAAGFDSDFIGFYARSARLFLLPEIQIHRWDEPGIRLTLEDVVIGNQGVSLEAALNWPVAFDANGNFLPQGTELLGYLVDEAWQIALSDLSGAIRHNIPESFGVRAYLRVPFFDAIFSTFFSFSVAAEADGSTAYQTAITIVKESGAPILVSFFNDGLMLTLNRFSASGLLSDKGFSIAGEAGFAVDIFGFALEAQSAAVSYAHLENSDDFEFTLGQVVLGELGTVEEAKLTLKSHRNEQGEIIFDQVEISAASAWANLQNLIPPDMRDVVGLPEDMRIEALLTWQEAEGQADGSRKLAVRLLTEASHLDRLWSFIPVPFRPEVRRVRSMFKLVYDSAEQFSPADAQGDPLPPPQAYTQRSGVLIELLALMEVKLPDLTTFSLPNFDLIRVETGDEDGFVTAEFKANYQSDSGDGDRFQSGLTVQNPIALDIALPGGDLTSPFIENALTKVGLQFAYTDNSEEEMEIGGKLLFEGDFAFRPLAPSDIPFADHFNLLMQNVGLDEVSGRSSLSVAFTEDRFDLTIDGEFDDFGIEIDIFKLLASLSPNNERPDGEEVEIDFQFGFQLIGFSFKAGTDADSENSDGGYYFEFKLNVECTMTGLPPLIAAITLSSDEFSFGLENLTIPLEVPRYPIDNKDLAQLQGGDGIWSAAAQQSYEGQLQGQIGQLDQQLMADGLPPRDEFRLLKDKTHLELKKLMLQLVMAIHQRVGVDGQPVFQGLIEIDTWAHATFLNLLHLETELKLHFPEIKFKIPFDDPSGISLFGTGHIVGFAEDDALKSLEAYFFTLGLSSEYIFCKIESNGEPILIPSFGTRYDDGSLSISKFMIGYGYTKNSFAVDFAGEIVIPSELIKDADTSGRLGAGVRLPHHNKLAFKLDLIPVSIGKATIIIPLPQFDLDLRTPSTPALASTARCEPHWDGFELNVRDVIHADLKRIAFSPFFGFAIIPNFKFDGDLELGDDINGLTLIVDDMLVLIGAFMGTNFPLPIPFFAEPTQPYFQNVCANLRVLGFEINFNMQRPFPNFSPMALFEVFGLLSNPMMEIDSNGSLANTIRFTLSDAYVRAPDFLLQMFPDAANFINRRYGFTLNLGTLITMAQSVAKIAQPAFESVADFIGNQSATLETVLNSISDTFNPWDWIALLPPELRKFRTGGQIAGFEASACLVIATGDEARQALKNKNAPKTNISPLSVDRQTDRSFITYSKTSETILTSADEDPLSVNWTKEGIAGGRWEKTDTGIAQTETINGISYLIHNRTTIPSHINVCVTIGHTDKHEPSAAGIVFCYADVKNHYVFRTWTTDPESAGAGNVRMGKRKIVIERKKNNVINQLAEKTIVTSPVGAIQLELTTFMDEGRRIFMVYQLTTNKVRGSNHVDTFAEKLFEVQEDRALENGSVGLYAKTQSVSFSDLRVQALVVDNASFGQISPSSLQSGFNVNLPAPQLNGQRFIHQNESSMLFKGIEFKKFNEAHIEQIPVGRLEHIVDVDAGVYVGAYVKVFTGQRFRFLGQIFSDGSFALVSEAESKPLNLSVLGIQVHLPFSGYGNLILVGRQKRSGYYGYIEAKGTFDWSPIPNLVRLRVGDRDRLATLKLHNNGQFELNASAGIYLFNGAATIAEGSVSITPQQAAFDGKLQFQLGADIPGDYRFTEILALDINGSGSVVSVERFSFRGRGDVRFLGESFSSVNVDVDEQYAYFDLRFRKPRFSGSSLESKFPILSSCDIDLRGSCKFRMRRTVRPEFRLKGEGRINVLGAEIAGKGEISSIPQKNHSLKNDVFCASMEGNLSWQGLKWLGGKISVGSNGLRISGTTNLGLQLTPAQVGPIKIANLFLNIQLEGRFLLNADKLGLYFLFRGHWTLGAAMADTGNAQNRQILPLASSEFVFSSGATLGTPTQYCLPLFLIDGFAFMPFKEATIPVPTVTLTKREGAKTLVKSGKTDTDPPDPALEFYTPLSNVGIKTTFPYVNWGPQNFQSSDLRELYSAYDVNFDVDQMTVDFENLSNIEISLCLDNNVDNNFPLRIKVESGGGTIYFPR